MKKLGLLFNLICSSLTVLLPLALYLKTGTMEHSFSSYHGTAATDILTYSLLIISLSFILSENIITGLFLIGVAIFDTHEYMILHNLFAYGFFLSATYSIVNDKRYRYIGIPIIFCAALIPIITLFWYEVIALLCLAIHGFLYSLKRLKLEIKKENNLKSHSDL